MYPHRSSAGSPRTRSRATERPRASVWPGGRRVLETVDYSVIALYFVVVIGLGFWYQKKASKSLVPLQSEPRVGYIFRAPLKSL